MRRHPVIALLLMLWHAVRALLLGVQYLVAEVFTFFLKTIPRIRRDVREFKEEDYKLADRLRRREN